MPPPTPIIRPVAKSATQNEILFDNIPIESPLSITSTPITAQSLLPKPQTQSAFIQCNQNIVEQKQSILNRCEDSSMKSVSPRFQPATQANAIGQRPLLTFGLNSRIPNYQFLSVLKNSNINENAKFKPTFIASILSGIQQGTPEITNDQLNIEQRRGTRLLSDVAVQSKFDGFPEFVSDKSMSGCKPPVASFFQSIQIRDSSQQSKYQMSSGSCSFGSELSNPSATTDERRNERIMRFWNKKQNRNSHKKVRYGCRQNLANQRFRHQGRFIKKEELEKLDPTEIFDPSMRTQPKTKPIFKISKESRNRSGISSADLSDIQKQIELKQDLTLESNQKNIIFGVPLKMPWMPAASLQMGISQFQDDFEGNESENRDENLSEMQAQADRVTLFSTELPRVTRGMIPQLQNQPSCDDVCMLTPSLFVGETFEFQQPGSNLGGMQLFSAINQKILNLSSVIQSKLNDKIQQSGNQTDYQNIQNKQLVEVYQEYTQQPEIFEGSHLL